MKENKEKADLVLPKEAVLEFMEIYKKGCKQKISFKEAQTEALNLLCLFNLLSQQ